MFNKTTIGLMALLLSLATTANAQDRDLVPDQMDTEKEDKGWVPKLVLSASFSFGHTSNVPSAQDGSTISLGGTLDSGIAYYGKQHEWRNTLNYQAVGSMSPAIEEFVKSTDSLVFESIYLYHIPGVHWLGPFVRFKLDSAIFRGKYVQADAKTFTVLRTDGTVDNLGSQSTLATTGNFEPLKLEESIGLFAQPVDTPPVKVEFRAGVGARQVFTNNSPTLSDDAATADIIEFSELKDSVQIGGELFAGVSGTVTWDDLGKDRPLTYSVNGEVLLPFYSKVETDAESTSDLDNTTVLLEAKLGVKLFAWMSLDYALKASREPLLHLEAQDEADKWGISNSLLLSFSYSVVE
ncbi:MAG: hypothetical protein ACI9OJ_000792 [Myxococcota bacterium]|jgi:hypothetical protein